MARRQRLLEAPVAGELADRYGRKAVLLPALLCMGAGTMDSFLG